MVGLLTGNVRLVQLVENKELKLCCLGVLTSSNRCHLPAVSSRCLLGLACYNPHLSGCLLSFLWVWVSSRPWCPDQLWLASFSIYVSYRCLLEWPI